METMIDFKPNKEVIKLVDNYLDPNVRLEGYQYVHSTSYNEKNKWELILFLSYTSSYLGNLWKKSPEYYQRERSFPTQIKINYLEPNQIKVHITYTDDKLL